MFVIKDRVKKYYKYVYVEWTQPILSSNGTMGGDSFACDQSSVYSSCYAWCAFAESGIWHSAEGQNPPQWLSWYNPRLLKINNIKINVGNGSTNPDLPNEYKIQGSDDNTNWVDVYSATNSQTSPIPLTLNIDLTSNPNRAYKYWRYYVVNVKSRNFGNASKIILDALEQQIVESTSSDYDFYVDDTIIYKTPNTIERKYYKYDYNPWTQPILSSNGTMGGDSFACDQSNLYNSEYAWRAFDGAENSGWTNNGNTGYLTFYNPKKLKVENIQVMNWYDGSYLRAIRSGSINVSNDGKSWTKIKDFTNSDYTTKGIWNIDLSDNSSFYNYYKIDVVGDGSYARITELTITATQLDIMDGTSSDYDFYEDINHTRVYKSF